MPVLAAIAILLLVLSAAAAVADRFETDGGPRCDAATAPSPHVCGRAA